MSNNNTVLTTCCTLRMWDETNNTSNTSLEPYTLNAKYLRVRRLWNCSTTHNRLLTLKTPAVGPASKVSFE